MSPNIVISRSFSAYFLRFPLISAANAEKASAFFGGSCGQNRRFPKGRKAISRLGTAPAQVARSRPRCAAGKSLFGADGRGVRGLARKGCADALKIRRFLLPCSTFTCCGQLVTMVFTLVIRRNLRKRFEQHAKGDAFATSYRGPWKLIYYEAYLEQPDALGRERYLKSGASRRFLRAQLAHYLRKNPIRSRLITSPSGLSHGISGEAA